MYLFFKSSASFFATLITGILIDVDHIFDYCIERGITFKIKNIYLWATERKNELLILCFHSIELVFIFWVIISLFKLGVFWVAFAIGITQHMLLDILFNKHLIYSYSYFLTFRIIKGFRKENFFRITSLPLLEK